MCERGGAGVRVREREHGGIGCVCECGDVGKELGRQ